MAPLSKCADGWQTALGGGIMRPLVVLVEILVKPSFVTQFRDLIAANAKTSLELEIGCKRFDVVVDPEEPRRFVLYEIYEDEAAFDEHLASSHYLSFADAIENELEQSSVRRLAFSGEMAISDDIPT
jgi:(4S)-4-hydroxy-5-phosphonooxypentane-2,3-dione isomerase